MNDKSPYIYIYSHENLWALIVFPITADTPEPPNRISDLPTCNKIDNDSFGSEAAVWWPEAVGFGKPKHNDPPTFSERCAETGTTIPDAH